jgi:urease accessory protein
VFAPDAVQAFAGSSYRQRQEFHLTKRAALVLVDWFTSGRAARGERWAFDRFQSRNDVFLEDRRIFVDSVVLNSESGPMHSSHRTGRFNCFAMMVLVGEALEKAAADLMAEISTRPVERHAALLYSASPIQHGAVLRLAADDAESVSHELRRHLKAFSELLGDDPWSRKW